MPIDQNTLERLIALLEGKLEDSRKSALLDEIAVDQELGRMFDLLKEMYTLKPGNTNYLISAAKKLSQSLYKDFIKQQKTRDKLYGIQIFDSSILPLPEGVRPAAVDTRRLKYKVGDALVELSTYPITVDSIELIGQISDIKCFQNITIKASTSAGDETVRVDEFGMFRFDRIVHHKCKLSFLFKDGKEAIIELKL